MYDIIEKLLILQDRDRRILQVREQLARLGPERETLRVQTGAALAALEAAKGRGKQIESERKQRELEVEAKKQQIGRYSLQQFQTKKNEEYRALAHEIEGCNAEIVKLEDAQLELMEQAEATQRELLAASRQAEELKRLADGQLKDLAGREQTLTAELAELEGNREQVKSAVDGHTLQRYERLLKMKGGSVVVGIQHGVCGGCHMKFPVQLMVACQAERELVTCPNCGRILYYTSDMDLAVMD
ncbi:MAG: C4-type zinc ribbon domain-containing protein [Verrucomicrobiota bacterium]|jgi:predicted  nucleic acid-binding Zn-ribbon protein